MRRAAHHAAVDHASGTEAARDLSAAAGAMSLPSAPPPGATHSGMRARLPAAREPPSPESLIAKRSTSPRATRASSGFARDAERENCHQPRVRRGSARWSPHQGGADSSCQDRSNGHPEQESPPT